MRGASSHKIFSDPSFPQGTAKNAFIPDFQCASLHAPASRKGWRQFPYRDGCPERGIDAVQECVGNTANEIGGADEYLKCDTPGYPCGCNRDGDDKTSQDADVLDGPGYPDIPPNDPCGAFAMTALLFDGKNIAEPMPEMPEATRQPRTGYRSGRVR